MSRGAPPHDGLEASDPRLSLAARLAHEAGQIAMTSRGRASATWKGPGDRVTDVDLAVQSQLVDRIRAAFPGDGVLAEEGVATGLDREFVWVVDPLDGTNNYVLGLPCFAVSIGVLRAGLPHAGVVHDPNTQFTCLALRGGGAVAAGRPLALADRPLTAASNVAARVPLDPRLEPVVVDWLRTYKFRGFGSVALHLAYAALGALDVLLDHKATLWDVAAGALALAEAGGAITDPHGRALFPADPAAYRGAPMPFLAGTPAAHRRALADCRAVLAGAAP
jgi:myo-inositol-1(or 4)-monophosphatase